MMVENALHTLHTCLDTYKWCVQGAWPAFETGSRVITSLTAVGRAEGMPGGGVRMSRNGTCTRDKRGVLEDFTPSTPPSQALSLIVEWLLCCSL